MMFLALLACTPPAAEWAATVSPRGGTATGYESITIELSGFADEPPLISRAWLGGVELFDLPDEPSESFVATGQGSPLVGEVDLVLEVEGESTTIPAAFEVAGPIDPVFGRMVGIGASFTMGVQNGVPSAHGALASPGMLVARQAGAHYSLPLLVPGLFPEIGTDDIGPFPACEVPDIPGFVANASADVITTLSDENGFVYWPGRETPDLMPQNLAVGGMKVGVLAFGTDAFQLNFLAHLVYDPYGDLAEPPPNSQLELAVASEPTLVVSFDLLGNDLIASAVSDRYLEPSLATPVEDLVAPLDHIAAELNATGAQVFIANMPDPTLLGAARQKQALMVAEGEYTSEEAAAVAAEIRGFAVAYNAVLADAIAPYPNIHVVDVASVVADLAANGRAVGDTTLFVNLVGGFVSLDGVHFSNTGYGLLADTFVSAINEMLGMSLPAIDLAAIYAEDPNNLATLLAGGFDSESCD